MIFSRKEGTKLKKNRKGINRLMDVISGDVLNIGHPRTSFVTTRNGRDARCYCRGAETLSDHVISNAKVKRRSRK